MSEIVDLNKFKLQKQNKIFLKKCNILLKDLYEIDKMFDKTLSEYSQYLKYHPVLSIAKEIKNRKLEIVKYIKHYEQVIRESNNGNSQK